MCYFVGNYISILRSISGVRRKLLAYVNDDNT